MTLFDVVHLLFNRLQGVIILTVEFSDASIAGAG